MLMLKLYTDVRLSNPLFLARISVRVPEYLGAIGVKDLSSRRWDKLTDVAPRDRGGGKLRAVNFTI